MKNKSSFNAGNQKSKIQKASDKKGNFKKQTQDESGIDVGKQTNQQRAREQHRLEHTGSD